MKTTARSRVFVVGLVAVAASLVLIALAGPWLAPHAPTDVIGPPFTPPGPGRPLGTDYLGSDVWSRLLHGGHTVIGLAAAATALAYLVGGTIGLAAGLARRADGVIMRPVDVLLAIPPFLVLAVLAAASGHGTVVVVVAGALANIPGISRVVRAAALEVSVRGYVEAAFARGESRVQVAIRDVTPNIAPALFADLGSRISGTVGLVASANFLGLGLQPPAADWALMVAENRTGLAVQPWAVLAPALLIALLTIAVNLGGDQFTARLRHPRGGTGSAPGQAGPPATVHPPLGSTRP